MTLDKPCSVDGCGKPVSRRGWCNGHYIKWRRKGTTDGDPSWVRGRHCKGTRGQCPAAKKLNNHLHYLQNKAAYIERARKFEELFPDKKHAYMTTEKTTNKNRSRAKQWRHDNPERKAAGDLKFRKDNPHLVRSYQARYRASILKATPPWLTVEMIKQIRKHYAEAERMTRESGVEHEVDHIVPLQGKIVCGLHVPWNLRVITAVENNRRSRVFSG